MTILVSRPHFILPNLCQTAPLVYMVLVAQVCVMAWELAGVDFYWSRFAFKSLAVQWIVLLSAAGLCALRPHLHKLTVRQGWWVCFALIEGVGIGVLVVIAFAAHRLSLAPIPIVQQAISVGLVALLVLRFFQLQQGVIEQNSAEATARMDALQARIKPHFLFNSLNTIAELINTRPTEAERSVENLASLFRANLKQTSAFCPLSEEVALVKGYVQLEQWRLGERLVVNWQVSLLNQQRKVPVLCLQPLVENAIVHGIATQKAGGELNISALQTPYVTTLIVENGIGDSVDEHKGHGVGLENVKHRLAVLYKGKARFLVEQTPSRYKVTMTLPS